MAMLTNRRKEVTVAATLVAPFVLTFALVFLYPAIRLVELSLTNSPLIGPGEWVGLDVKAMRTQKREQSFAHLKHSRETFLLLVEKARTLDERRVAELIARRDYEELDQLILEHLLGR